MKKVVYRVLLTVNIFLAACLLVAYLAVHINPVQFVLPAFFGLAYPYLLLLNILMVITWALLLRPEALISVGVIALGITHLSNYIRINRSESTTEGTFKMMSYNVRLFNVYESRTASSERLIMAFLREQKPDIICLQEFYLTGDPEQKDRSLRSALGGKYYSHMKISGTRRNNFYGIVTYSKFPIVYRGQFTHPGSSSLSIYTDVLIENDTFRIYNNHLESFRLKTMERSFFEEMTSASDNEALESVKNLSVSLRKAFVRRAEQADLVKAHASQSPHPVIIAGDFNDTPVSYSYRKIRRGLNDAFVNSGYGAGFTYKGNYPANRIDYILYDDSLESIHFEISRIKYSDHYPISAYLKKSN